MIFDIGDPPVTRFRYLVKLDNGHIYQITADGRTDLAERAKAMFVEGTEYEVIQIDALDYAQDGTFIEERPMMRSKERSK